MPILPDVHKLFGGPANAHRTVRSRWHSRLQPVWLYRKRWVAFSGFSQNCWPSASQSPRPRIHGCRQVDRKQSPRIEQSTKMENSSCPAGETAIVRANWDVQALTVFHAIHSQIMGAGFRATSRKCRERVGKGLCCINGPGAVRKCSGIKAGDECCLRSLRSRERATNGSRLARWAVSCAR